ANSPAWQQTNTHEPCFHRSQPGARQSRSASACQALSQTAPSPAPPPRAPDDTAAQSAQPCATDDDAPLGSQLLADHIDVPAMTAQALPQPGLLAIERLLAPRLSIRLPPRILEPQRA